MTQRLIEVHIEESRAKKTSEPLPTSTPCVTYVMPFMSLWCNFDVLISLSEAMDAICWAPEKEDITAEPRRKQQRAQWACNSAECRCCPLFGFAPGLTSSVFSSAMEIIDLQIEVQRLKELMSGAKTYIDTRLRGEKSKMSCQPPPPVFNRTLPFQSLEVH